MEKCAHCQASLDPTWKFCVTCGAPSPADAETAPHNQQTPSEQHLFLSGEQGQPLTRAAAKAAAAQAATATATATATKSKPGNIGTAMAPGPFAEGIPAAIRDSQGGQPARAMGRRKVDVPLIVSISLGVAGAALIVYLVILVFGPHG